MIADSEETLPPPASISRMVGMLTPEPFATFASESFRPSRAFRTCSAGSLPEANPVIRNPMCGLTATSVRHAPRLASRATTADRETFAASANAVWLSPQPFRACFIPEPIFIEDSLTILFANLPWFGQHNSLPIGSTGSKRGGNGKCPLRRIDYGQISPLARSAPFERKR